MMNIIRTAVRSKWILRRNSSAGPIGLLPPRPFSTEAAATPDPSVQSPDVTYGRLVGVNKHTLKTDVVNLLEGCGLSLDDVRTQYNNNFMPLSMLVKFPSLNAYEKALKLIPRTRVYLLDRVDYSQWDSCKDYGGKTLLLQGIPRQALADDVDRFLSGCDYDAASMQVFNRQAVPEPMKMAIVPFSSPIQAMNAFLTRNRGYCLNNQIHLRVLQ